jgi:hypothetical protein
MNMKALLLALAACCVTPAFACENPTVAVVPDGTKATMDQLLEAQAQVKTYMAAMEEYIACLDDAVTAAGEEAPAEFKAMMVNRHNIAVGEMEAVAARFNDQVKAYKTANPE